MAYYKPQTAVSIIPYITQPTAVFITAYMNIDDTIFSCVASTINEAVAVAACTSIPLFTIIGFLKRMEDQNRGVGIFGPYTNPKCTVIVKY